ncbi:MAG: hypothetical protein ABIF88_04080 [archaeon]
MALDDTFEKLTAVENGVRGPNPNYSVNSLYEAHSGLTKLGETNTRTVEGQNENQQLTGDDPTKLTQGDVEKQQKARLTIGWLDLDAYVNRHFGNIAGEIGEPRRSSLAYHFAPDMKAPAGNDAYEKTRERVANAKETIRLITEEPDTFIAREIVGKDSMVARYIALFPEEHMEHEQGQEARRAEIAIRAHGSDKFLADTKRLYEPVIADIETRSKALEAEEKQVVDAAEIAKVGILSAAEKAFLMQENGFMERAEQIAEDKSKAKKIQPLTQEVLKYAVGAIHERNTNATANATAP